MFDVTKDKSQLSHNVIKYYKIQKSRYNSY